ncbi:hypothetical protein FNH09_22315 [Streptomyces adustus]|uniref:Uncharacterized protein n=1 Tax=Streptomyces adustus TaxID=1609272 RepID=A0A5N8VF52_9ACTN|nr:hypothetical protein [Streptomyces adustus]MPY33873.1 hypothetical protein [Streptomyces adustus]
MAILDTKRTFVCVVTGLLLVGGTAIGTDGTGAAASPKATAASVLPAGSCNRWQWIFGYYDFYHVWHKGHWVCKSRPIDPGTNLNPVPPE